MREGFDRNDVQKFVADIFEEDVHAKRILSMANATTGVLAAGSLAASAIGQGLAHVCGLDPKHTVKQVDRLLGNAKMDVWSYFAQWVPYVVGERRQIAVALDWTDFDRDGQTTIALNLMTSHGRAIPLIWRTVRKTELKDNRNHFEDSVLTRLRETLPEGVAVTVVADRGFMDTKLMEVMRDSWGFDYVIRLRGNVTVTDSKGEKRTAAQWVGAGGRAQTIRNAKLTSRGFTVPTVVCVQDPAMKDSWCLASSDPNASAAELKHYYGKRWSIETYFRDTKDIRFGMGMDAIHTKSPARRDRLFLISAFAVVLLTLLGAACEQVGYDRYLKANTVKRRTHSLFRQGQMVYDLIPRMREEWLNKIMQAFVELIQVHRALSQVFFVV
jgi:hypothetical protein